MLHTPLALTLSTLHTLLALHTRSVLCLLFCVICVVLLIRLLMAMMTTTFRTVHEKAQLEWRLVFARNVLRLELVHINVVCPLQRGLGTGAGTPNMAGTRSPVDGAF